MDQSLLEDIARFKEALQRSEDESDSDAEFVGATYSNRGKKLKRGAREVYQGKLNIAPFEGHGVRLEQYGDRKQAVVYKKRKIIYQEDEEKGEDEDEDDIDNPYDDIKLDDLLAPIGHPSEVPIHESASKTYTSNTIAQMAKRALEIINEEQKQTIQFARLMRVFLGDDPYYARSKNLNLPAYDHLHDSTNDHPNATEEENGLQQREAAANGTGERRLTRGKLNQEFDPFFDKPQIQVDRNFGIPQDQAEETRQLTQIALQRCEELVRCMTDVRKGLVRADGLRETVYKWCKEMNGDGEGLSEGGDNADETEDSEND